MLANQLFVSQAEADSITREWNLSKGWPLNRYFDDGWEANLPLLRRPNKYRRVAARMRARRNTVEPRMVDDLLDQVAGFFKKSIAVFGYRPPSSPRLRALESEFSGLDFASLARDMKQADATWLEVDPSEYPTFDGAHLDYLTAMRFSRRLGDDLNHAINSC